MESTRRKRFDKLRMELSSALIERDEEIDCLLLGLVAGEHVLFVGAPGTAKSMLCNALGAGISGARVFSRLLTKFTTPDEVFGPWSLVGMRSGVYERLIDGYMPSSDITFIDEIWKASSAILNCLLTIMEERLIDQGPARIPVPLRMVVCASNEWPGGQGQEDVSALFDRCLIRRTVRPVSPSRRSDLMFASLPTVSPCIDLSDVDGSAVEAAGLAFSDAARTSLLQIVEELGAAGIRPGDRRLRKSLKVARAGAWLAGSAEVLPVHLEPLQYVLWSDPVEQPGRAAEIVCRIANPVGARLQQILRDVDEIMLDPEVRTDAAKRVKAIKQLEVCESEAKSQLKGGNGRAQKVFSHIRRERIGLNAIQLGISPEKALAILGAE